MLGQLHSSNFLPHIDKPCRLEAGNVIIDVVLSCVTEKPRAHAHLGTPLSRIPFVLQFSGASDCPWNDGIFTLQFHGMEAIPGIYLNRILNTSEKPASLFQAVFN